MPHSYRDSVLEAPQSAAEKDVMGEPPCKKLRVAGCVSGGYEERM